MSSQNKEEIPDFLKDVCRRRITGGHVQVVPPHLVGVFDPFRIYSANTLPSSSNTVITDTVFETADLTESPSNKTYGREPEPSAIAIISPTGGVSTQGPKTKMFTDISESISVITQPSGACTDRSSKEVPSSTSALASPRRFVLREVNVGLLPQNNKTDVCLSETAPKNSYGILDDCRVVSKDTLSPAVVQVSSSVSDKETKEPREWKQTFDQCSLDSSQIEPILRDRLIEKEETRKYDTAVEPGVVQLKGVKTSELEDINSKTTRKKSIPILGIDNDTSFVSRHVNSEHSKLPQLTISSDYVPISSKSEIKFDGKLLTDGGCDLFLSQSVISSSMSLSSNAYNSSTANALKRAHNISQTNNVEDIACNENQSISHLHLAPMNKMIEETPQPTVTIVPLGDASTTVELSNYNVRDTEETDKLLHTNCSKSQRDKLLGSEASTKSGHIRSYAHKASTGSFVLDAHEYLRTTDIGENYEKPDVFTTAPASCCCVPSIDVIPVLDDALVVLTSLVRETTKSVFHTQQSIAASMVVKQENPGNIMLEQSSRPLPTAKVQNAEPGNLRYRYAPRAATTTKFEKYVVKRNLDEVLANMHPKIKQGGKLKCFVKDSPAMSRKKTANFAKHGSDCALTGMHAGHHSDPQEVTEIVRQEIQTVENRRHQLLKDDSFNRPDSPMFHETLPLPKDSVIKRNREHRSGSTSGSDSCGSPPSPPRQAARSLRRCRRSQAMEESTSLPASEVSNHRQHSGDRFPRTSLSRHHSGISLRSYPSTSSLQKSRQHNSDNTDIAKGT